MFRTSPTTWSAKNLSQINVAKNVKVGGSGGNDYEEKTAKKLPSKNLNKVG